MRREGKACAAIMFDPKWWHRNYGLDFGRKYYENPLYRAKLEQKMKRALFERFGEIGLGVENPEPVISPQHCPLCYTISEMFGCKVLRWEPAGGPWVIEAALPGEVIDEMEPLDVFKTPPFASKTAIPIRGNEPTCDHQKMESNMRIEIGKENPEAEAKLPGNQRDGSRIGVSYADVILKGIKTELEGGDKKGEGLMRRLEHGPLYLDLPNA